MEEKAIKDFDRGIENRMNDHVAAPPFGAWNRIAAELEAGPVAVVSTTAPAQPWINTGTVLGFVSGALMIGTFVGSWLLYNKYNANEASAIVQRATEVAAQVNTVSVPVVSVEQPKGNILPSAKNVVVLAANKPTKETEYTTVRLNSNEDVAAPTVKLPMDKQKGTDEPYYFPPVDINVPEAKAVNTEIAEDNLQPEVKEVDEPAKTVEVKKITSSSSSSHVKFKKKRSSGWNYGKINRTKSRSKY